MKTKKVASAAEAPIREFAMAQDWASWLDENHSREEGIWLRFYKKGSGVQSVTYAEALDEALCYGWIDGQLKRLDEKSYLQRFTPRRPRSLWSQRNVENVFRLTNAGRMKAPGLAQVEKAKRDGRLERAYHPPSAMQMPEELLRALERNQKAKRFFESLNKTNRYAIVWRIQTAKRPETKQKRLEFILQMLAAGKKFY